jgi:DNA-directed RNA polymerase specialized sigma54-like protein
MLYNSTHATPAIGGGELDEARPRRVSDLLREGIDRFSRSQKAIARYIIDHLEEVGYLSAEELGQKGKPHHG